MPSPESKKPSSIEEMAAAMIAHIEQVRPNGPSAIAGYSADGILAYEVTKQLVYRDYPVPFLGLIDTYAHNASTLFLTEIFLIHLRIKFPVFQTFNDFFWWDSVSKLTLSKAIEEMHKIDLDLSNIDFEWETLLAKQCFNYQNICNTFKIDSLYRSEVH